MLLFAGTSIADFDTISGAHVSTVTTVGNIASGCKEGIKITGDATESFVQKTFDPVDEIFVSTMFYHNGAASTTIGGIGILGDGDDFDFIRMYQNNANMRMMMRNATTGHTFLADRPCAVGVLHRLDIHAKWATADGFIRFYIDEQLVFEFTGNTNVAATQRSATRLRLKRTSTSATSSADYSNILIGEANTDTKPLNIIQRLPTADAVPSDWTGSFADVTGPGLNTATFIESGAVNDKEIFTTTDDVSTVPDIAIYAVVHSIRARRVKEQEGAVASVIRVGGTDYESAPVNPAFSSFGAHQFQFLNNPATGVPFTKAELADTEFGVIAKLAQA